MINICLLYTTYHSYIWEKIQQAHTTTENTIVLNFSKRRIKKQRSNIVIIDRSRDSKIKILIESLKVAITCKFKKYNLTLPHPDHLLGNNLFFNKNVNTITWIEDGILNYYTTDKIDHGILKRQKKRALITYFTPFRYKRYSGHLSGINAAPTTETRGWFYAPKLVANKSLFKEILQIPKNQHKEKTANTNIALLIEQPLEVFLSAGLADQIRKKTKDFLESQYQKVAIKKHPEHINTKHTNINNGIILQIDDSLPVEEQINLINPTDVIGFCSTALVNIKRSNSHIRCIAIGINEIMGENPTLNGLKELFEDSGVEIN